MFKDLDNFAYVELLFVYKIYHDVACHLGLWRVFDHYIMPSCASDFILEDCSLKEFFLPSCRLALVFYESAIHPFCAAKLSS